MDSTVECTFWLIVGGTFVGYFLARILDSVLNFFWG